MYFDYQISLQSNYRLWQGLWKIPLQLLWPCLKSIRTVPTQELVRKCPFQNISFNIYYIILIKLKLEMPSTVLKNLSLGDYMVLA